MDNELIKIEKQVIGTEEVNAVDARELWKFLGSKRDFSNWITKRISGYGFDKSIDYEVYNKFVVNSGSVGGRPRIDYILSLDMAKEIAMVERNQKGREIRRYFIDCEKALKKIISNTVSELKDQVLHLEQIIAKAESIQICEFAKNISKTFGKTVGGNALFKILRDKKYLMEGRGRPEHNKPYQKYINKGFFELKASKIGCVGNTTYITMLGREKIAPVLIKELKLLPDNKEPNQLLQTDILEYIKKNVKSITLELKK